MLEEKDIEVLLLEDNEADAGIVRRYLQESRAPGFHVVWMRTVAEACAWLKHARPGVGIIDHDLGSRDGLSFLREADEAGVRAPWIILTGAGNLGLAMEAQRLGAMEFLDKGELSPPMLVRTIRYAMENFHAREELRAINDLLETRVRQRTRELEQSNRDLANFAHVVSHELRLPLKAIIEHISMAQFRGTHGSEDAHLAHALDAARGLQALVRSMLDFARLGTDGKRFLPASMRVMAESAARELEPLVQEKAARITIGPLPVIIGDPYFLGLLFQHLIGNALQHAGGSPCITVTASRENGAWRFHVADNGRGISAEERNDLFSLFDRTNRTSSGEGYGVGLPLCRRIVEHHGGRIWVESPAGGGAVFTFSIPAHAGDALDRELAAGVCG
jgi:signal transduction histidine kinase